MRRSVVVVIVVVLLGYGLYGVLFVAGTSGVEMLQSGDAVSTPSAVGEEGGEPVGDLANGSGINFSLADAGVDYTFKPDSIGDMAMVSDAGVYAGDYDGDGWTDLLAVGNDERGPVLYENVGGSFEPSGALPAVERDLWGAAFVDHNVDGRPDIVLLANNATPLLLENRGDAYAKREDVFDRPLPVGFGATAGDYNRDGCPDLFVYQYGNWTEGLPEAMDDYEIATNADNGHPNVLYRGTCSGFERVEAPAIRGNQWTLAASFVDLTGDGRPDVHVANDINHDLVYRNLGNGSFEQVVLPNRTNRHAMSSEVADVTLDGRPDVFVTNIFYPEWVRKEVAPEFPEKGRGNNLISALGNGTFVVRGGQYGIRAGGWGWAAVIADLDNDGDEDLFQTTQDVTFSRRDLLMRPERTSDLNEKAMYNYPVLWERRSLTSFERVSASSAGFVPSNGRGVARLDYDNDGDADLVVATAEPNGSYAVYENRGATGNAVQVRVLGRNGSQSAAYGAMVTVTAGDTSQRRRVHARTDYNSQDARIAHVGVGNHTRVDVRVVWPDGTERVFEGVPAGQRLVVTPGGITRRIDLAG